MKNIGSGTFFGIVALVLVLNSSLYIVGEWQQAVVVQLGRIVGEPKTKAGLQFKIPFMQDVRFFEKRMITWDGKPEMVPTADKKYIFVDTTARWKITDPRRFYEAVQSEQTATQRIASIIEGKTKNIVSKYRLVETVRNTNEIIENLEKEREAAVDQIIDPELAIEEKITGEIEKVYLGREKLAHMITESARKEVKTFGIELIDVLIRRIAYEPSVETKVFDRMISERTRIAEKIRSVGKGEEAKIKGTLNLDLKKIESEAYRVSQEFMGKAEADSMAIYSKALKKDPGYYSFIRTLDAYKKAFPNRANFIISTDSEFLKMLKRSDDK